VRLPYPRDRRTVNENHEFKRIRNEVIDYLLRTRDRNRTSLTRSLVLPDVEPEDITHKRPPLFGRGGRRRPSELKTVKVEVEP
jgi:nitrate/nitrite transport system ATP-binding protein